MDVFLRLRTSLARHSPYIKKGNSGLAIWQWRLTAVFRTNAVRKMSEKERIGAECGGAY
jgi:hypothetical protein